MVKKIAENVGPHIADVLEVLGLIPATSLGQILLANKKCERPQLRKVPPLATASKRDRVTLEEAARILKCPKSRIVKILKAIKSEPDKIPEV